MAADGALTASLATLLPLALGAFVLAGFLQSVSGFGAALVAVPLLALALGPVPAVVAVTTASLVLSGWAARRERAHVDVPLARTLVLSGLVGLPLGLVLLRVLPPAGLQLLMAVVVLAALVLVLRRSRLPGGGAATSAAGLVSGALLTSTGMNGPPLVLAVAGREVSPRRFRATLQTVLCVQDAAAVLGFLVVGAVSAPALVAALVGTLAAPLGWRLGDRVFHRVPPAGFHRVVAAALLASALLLLLDGAHSLA